MKINFNQAARSELANRCHKHDLSRTDYYGSTEGYISMSSIDNFARKYDLLIDELADELDGKKRIALDSEKYASQEKIEKACNCKMFGLEDNLDYLYRVVFYKIIK